MQDMIASDRLKELERHRDERRVDEDRARDAADSYLRDRDERDDKDRDKGDSASGVFCDQCVHVFGCVVMFARLVLAGVALSRMHTDPLLTRPPSPSVSLPHHALSVSPDHYLNLLTRGSVFLKHGRKGWPHPR
jgi:hypothetical protein